MTVKETGIKGLIVIEPQVFEDPRGYFFESYNFKNLEDKGIAIKFFQDNQSKSSYGVIRGLHYQLNPYSQTKLLRVLQGKIYDVAVDIRKGSPTFGKWFGLELAEENKKQLLVPQGFAHGFSVLSETAVVLYKCDNYYHKDSERGIIYNDPKLNIDWQVPEKDVLVSEKDSILPTLENAETNFVYDGE